METKTKTQIETIREGVSFQIAPMAAEEIFYNALCNTICGTELYGGIGLKTKAIERAQAAENLKKKKELGLFIGEICQEDIWMEVLRMGGVIMSVDYEGQCADWERSITLQDVHKNINKLPFWALSQMLEQQDDLTTADAVIQTIFFCEIIFG